MRNTIVQSLPPGATLIVEIAPPMSPDERHYVLGVPSFQPVVVRAIDTAHVEITNPHDKLVFFIFCVGPAMRLPTGMHEAISAFLSARKNL